MEADHPTLYILDINLSVSSRISGRHDGSGCDALLTLTPHSRGAGSARHYKILQPYVASMDSEMNSAILRFSIFRTVYVRQRYHNVIILAKYINKLTLYLKVLSHASDANVLKINRILIKYHKHNVSQMRLETIWWCASTHHLSTAPNKFYAPRWFSIRTLQILVIALNELLYNIIL